MNLNRENASISGLKALIMLEGQVHCGWCHPWLPVLGAIKKQTKQGAN